MQYPETNSNGAVRDPPAQPPQSVEMSTQQGPGPDQHKYGTEWSNKVLKGKKEAMMNDSKRTLRTLGWASKPQKTN